MAKVTRTNISVPAELKARMDAVEEPTNWSAVACAAFEQRLAEVITRKGARDMKDVIARLKASKQKTDSETCQRGHRDGRGWAAESAEAVELERLEEAETGEAGVLSDHSHRTCGEVFVDVIRSDDDDRDYLEFWQNVFWHNHVDDAGVIERLSADPEYVAGFIQGAREVWAEVKDQL